MQGAQARERVNCASLVSPRKDGRQLAGGELKRPPRTHDTRNWAGKGWIPPTNFLTWQPAKGMAGFFLRFASYDGLVVGAFEWWD